MKQLLCFFTFCLCVQVYGQKDFEGMIRYNITEMNRGDNGLLNGDVSSVRIFFTPGKILIKIEEEKEVGDLLLNLDSAKSYRINHIEKTYFEKKMDVHKTPTGQKHITILNHKATLAAPASGVRFPMGGTGNFWFADDLFFHVPPGLAANEDLIMINDNRLLLKGEMMEREYGEPDEEESNDGQPFLTIEAVEIIPGNINLSDFVIPGDYTVAASEYDKDMPVADTAIIMADSMAMPVEAPPPPPPPVKKPVPKKTTTTNKKSPARKE